MNNSKIYSILIVEDEAITALSIEQLLISKGFHVAKICFSAEEALEVTPILKPDLVLMDITLAGEMKGYEAAHILNLQFDIPVIFLSSYSQENIVEQASKSGSFAYILKPHNNHLLIANIEMVLEKHRLAKESKELNQTKDKFFSIIAHDLRNPLSALHKTASLLDEKLDSITKDDLRFFIQEMSKSARQLYELSDNLLEWARIQTHKIQYNPTRIELDKTLRFIISILQTQLREKRIECALHINTNKSGYADINMLNSVLNNLLTNAIKFSNIGSQIDLFVDEKNNELEFQIIDQGIGIAPEYIDKVLTGAYRNEGTIHERGTGLGLLVCKDFIEMNKGRLMLKSELQKGTTVFFTIPTFKA